MKFKKYSITPLLFSTLFILSCESPLGVLGPVDLTIISQPTDLYVVVNKPALFSVDAIGNSLQYQWYDADGAILKGIRSTLAVSNFSEDDSGSEYWCRVIGSGDTLITDKAKLFVISKPTVSVPENQFRVTVGNDVTMAVESSSVQITYQWKKGAFPIFGATKSEYTIRSVSMANNGDIYTCVVTNSEGFVTSEPIYLTVTK